MEVEAREIVSRGEDDSLQMSGLDRRIVRRGILAPPFICYLRSGIVVLDLLLLRFVSFVFFEANMAGGRRKRKHRPNPSNKINRSARIQTKELEVFVTDFLTDPCGLPVEMRDYILVDGITPMNDTPGFEGNLQVNECSMLSI